MNLLQLCPAQNIMKECKIVTSLKLWVSMQIAITLIVFDETFFHLPLIQIFCFIIVSKITGMDKSDCECDDAYFEQTLAAQNSDPIKTHPAGHHLVQTCPPNHAGESNSLIQNHQATIVSSANEHMMLAPTLSADDLINAVNRHR